MVWTEDELKNGFFLDEDWHPDIEPKEVSDEELTPIIQKLYKKHNCRLDELRQDKLYLLCRWLPYKDMVMTEQERAEVAQKMVKEGFLTAEDILEEDRYLLDVKLNKK